MANNQNLHGKRRPSTPIEYKSWREGRVGITHMAGILGILAQHLSDLTRAGRVATEVIDGQRWYKVDEVLERAFSAKLPFPPLRVKQKAWLEDALWAWEAVSLGPWNCKRAPSGRAWRLYLDAKTDSIVRRSLSRAHMVLANRELRQIGDWTPEPDRAEELERSQPKIPGNTWESAAPEEKLSPGEIALKQLEAGYLDGPLSVRQYDGSVEPPDEPVTGSGETDY